MSYEDTNCPCGDKKERNTMLCPICMETFANHSAMPVFLDREADREHRRNAALILVSLAGSRKQRRAS